MRHDANTLVVDFNLPQGYFLYKKKLAVLDVAGFEPASALFAGADGLDDYRRIIPALPRLLAPGGAAILEIGHRQRISVSELAEAAGFAVACKQDLGGRDRALLLTRP